MNRCPLFRASLWPVLLALALLAWAPAARAACVLACFCTATTTSVAFGTYAPLSGAALDGVGGVTVTCGGVLGLGVPYSVALGTGANSAQFSPRKMASLSNRLNYNLYTDAARSLVWGDGSAGTQTVSGTVTILLLAGTSQAIPVYGRIPASQTTTPVGVYSDSVVVTVTYN